MKKLTICGKEYEICTNAFCMFEYKKQFKSGILADINKMAMSQNEGEMNLENIDNIIQIPLQLAYTFIKVANRNFMDFEDWLKTIENINLEDKWLVEVTELAVNSFLGQGTSNTDGTSKEQE